MRRFLTVLVLALAFPAAATAAPCETSGSTTLVETRFAVIFEKDKAYRGDRVPVLYGCVKSIDRFRRLGRKQIVPTDDALLRLEGRYAAHLLRGSFSGDLVLRDLRTGDRVFNWPLPQSSGQQEIVHAIELKRDGSLAWIQESSAAMVSTRRVLIRGLSGAEPRVLDEGPQIDPQSLAANRANTRLYWTNDGAARTATFE